MRNTNILIATIGIALLMAGSACAESLWTSESSSAYAKKRAAKVGDILTVVIVESADSSISAATDAAKDSKTDLNRGVGPLINAIAPMSYSGGDSFGASGSTTRSMQFSTKMTVTVTKVDANGNLSIEGTRFVQSNKEKEEVKLTGLVRPEDVDVNNTIVSSSIANAVITSTGSGPVSSRQKEGVITRILRILF